MTNDNVNITDQTPLSIFLQNIAGGKVASHAQAHRIINDAKVRGIRKLSKRKAEQVAYLHGMERAYDDVLKMADEMLKKFKEENKTETEDKNA